MQIGRKIANAQVVNGFLRKLLSEACLCIQSIEARGHQRKSKVPSPKSNVLFIVV